MNREGFGEEVNFFIGKEVEHTPAFGKKTLFVIGVQDTSKIAKLYQEHNCEHIYFGANMSFSNPPVNDYEAWGPWENMIREILELDYLCSLDIDVSCVEGLHESCLCEYINFIPVISVKLPYLQLLGYNATIKIDDKDFKATNYGVWCYKVNDLLNYESFTPWSNYTKDEIIK